jgi:sulfoxide reductase heme-binding subunit YedZ
MAYRILLGDGLGADPTQVLTHWSGFTAVVVLLVSLAVTPVRRITGWNQLQKIRRMLGLWAFAYAAIHVFVYAYFDQVLALDFILEDVLERPFTLVGAASFLLLLPLAVTSTRGWIRRLGKNWTRLHWLVYPAAVLAVIHFELGQKTDFTAGPVTLAVVLAALFGIRVWYAARRRAGTSRGAPTAARPTES